MRGGQQAQSRLRVPKHECLDNQVAVDCAGDGPAHAHILEQRVAQVKGQILNLRPATVFHLQVRSLGEYRQGIHGKGIDGQVGGAFLQFERLRDGVRDHGEAHALNERRCSPAQRIALEDDILIDLLAHETKWPGAHRMLPEIATAALGNNADTASGKIGEQKIVSVFQMKNYCLLVGSFHCVHRRVGRGLGGDHRA